MIKKLFYLISAVMIVYTGMMIRMRPGQMFNNKSPSKAKAAKASPILEQKEDNNFRKSFELEEERKVILRNFTGTLTVQRRGEYLDLKKGMTLKFQDRLRTGKKSVAILSFANNSIIKVFSNSIFYITKIQNRERSASNLQFNLFELKKGALLVDFINQGNSHFLEISSPASVIQIRGTQFLYLHNNKVNRSQLAVRQGIVKVLKNGSSQSKFVIENQGILINQNRPLIDSSASSWVKKINWSKLARGSGIDLYDSEADAEAKDSWRRRRKKLQEYSLSKMGKNLGDNASKSKAGGFLKSVVGKVLKIGGAMAEKGVDTFKKAKPVSNITHAGNEMRNFEEDQKKKIKMLDSIED